MTKAQLFSRLEAAPVIAALKEEAQLKRCLQSRAAAVFILHGDILHIDQLVERIKQAGKAVFVHIDLIDGLASREVAVDFIRGHTSADGIISTKAPLTRYAKNKGLFSVQRFFLLDSMALVNINRQMEADGADMVEVLPGLMPKIIGKIAASAKKPIIAGGLIADKEDIMTALGAGAMAVSTTSPALWDL